VFPSNIQEAEVKNLYIEPLVVYLAPNNLEKFITN
jgi:hypothetical protein